MHPHAARRALILEARDAHHDDASDPGAQPTVLVAAPIAPTTHGHLARAARARENPDIGHTASGRIDLLPEENESGEAPPVDVAARDAGLQKARAATRAFDLCGAPHVARAEHTAQENGSGRVTPEGGPRSPADPVEVVPYEAAGDRSSPSSTHACLRTEGRDTGDHLTSGRRKVEPFT